MKRILFLSCALVASLGLIAHMCQYKQMPRAFTTISFFLDYKSPHLPDNQTVLADLIKALKAEADHIFVNPLIWYAIIQELNKGSFKINKDNWEIYDTTLGLLYVKHIDAPQHVGINLMQFKQLSDPFDKATLKQVPNKDWTKKLDGLFDLPQWRHYHSHLESKVLIYMCGHGSEEPPKDSPAQALVCNLPARIFADILLFFNNELNITTLSIQSCHWPAERLLKLAQEHADITSLNFNIITPLNSQEILWLTTLEHLNCRCAKCQAPSFFNACRTFTHQYEGNITDEIKAIINDADTVRHNLEHKQKPTLIAAQSRLVCTL